MPPVPAAKPSSSDVIEALLKRCASFAETNERLRRKLCVNQNIVVEHHLRQALSALRELEEASRRRRGAVPNDHLPAGAG